MIIEHEFTVDPRDLMVASDIHHATNILALKVLKEMCLKANQIGLDGYRVKDAIITRYDIMNIHYKVEFIMESNDLLELPKTDSPLAPTS